MRIIPAIDIIDGKCVRLSQGDYQQMTVYHNDPVDVAKRFEDHGITYLHLVDLDGAKAGRIVNFSILEKIATQTGLKIDFGGGIRDKEDVSIVIDSGGRQAVIGSMAFKERDLFFDILSSFGPESIVLGADARGGKIAVGGWLETTELDLWEAVEEYYTEGVQYVLCTDIDRDGMMQGPSAELYESLLEHTPGISLIASGGIRDMDDVEAVDILGCEAVVIGKAIYEGAITLKELEDYMI